MCSLWGLVVAGLLSALFAIWGNGIIEIMTTSEDVRAFARLYLPYLIATPVVGWAAFMLDGIFIGATATRDMRNMMVVSFGVYCVAVAALVPTLANHGLWLALLISFVVRGITLGLRYPALEARVNAA